MFQTMYHAHNRQWLLRLLLLNLALFGAASGAWADNSAAFDLAGPQVEITVSRAGKTLPIAEVPNLQAGRPPVDSSRSARATNRFITCSWSHFSAAPQIRRRTNGSHGRKPGTGRYARKESW